MADEQEFVPKEFNDANIRAAREFKAQRDALVKALEGIADFCSADVSKLGAIERLAAIQNSARQAVLAVVGTVQHD